METRPANWAVGAFIPSGGGNAVPNLISSSDRLAPCNKEKQLQTNAQEENDWHIEQLAYLGFFYLLDRYKAYKFMILLFFSAISEYSQTFLVDDTDRPLSKNQEKLYHITLWNPLQGLG